MPPTESLLDEGGWSEWLEEQRKQEQLHKLRRIGISEDLISESIQAEGLVPPQGNGLVSSVPETEDQRMFRENAEFYQEHPTETLELTPLPYHTQFGRRVYKDQFDVVHSESTTTLKAPNGEWMNIPVIFNGQYVSEQDAKKIIVDNGMLDPETGETIKTYKTLEEAEEAAKQRMRELNDPSLPWNLEGTDWITNFPAEHLDWKKFLFDLGVDSPFINWPLRRRRNPNIPEVEEWNP